MTSSSEQQAVGKPGAARGGASRVSLACLACRTRHIRCDATKPVCKRCEEDGKECNYTKSRRGGLDRAALAARRERLAKQSSSTSPREGSDSVGSENHQPLATEPDSSLPLLSECFTEVNGSFPGASYLETNSTDASILSSSDPGIDPFINVYYKCFHAFHPFVLPLHRLLHYAEDSTWSNRLKPVISCVRYIGALYARSGQSGQLAMQAVDDIIEAKAVLPTCPFLCQAQLLYSIVLFWSGSRPQALSYINDTVGIATALGMSRQDFAIANSDGDPVLAESWRRTWWQLYIVDSNYAAIRRDTDFLTRDVPATVDLPCEEREYNSGVCELP